MKTEFLLSNIAERLLFIDKKVLGCPYENIFRPTKNKKEPATQRINYCI